jgi:nicotinate-nucleotide pyrophosphorylase (carboxylating)
MIPDIRQEIFRECSDRRVTGVLIAEAPGVLSGIARAGGAMESLGVSFTTDLEDGSTLEVDQEIARAFGNPVQIAMAEERIIGAVSKTSGIATAARRARLAAAPRCQVVSGGWKKMPWEVKDLVRQAVSDGGINARISENPMVYLDKNYVRILGGVQKAVQTVNGLDREIVIQVRGETGSVGDEAIEASGGGVSVVMVDTGRREDMAEVIRALKERGLRSRVRIAFAGNISIDDLEELSRLDFDIVDIGYAILDAPCLPMRFDVIKVA